MRCMICHRREAEPKKTICRHCKQLPRKSTLPSKQGITQVLRERYVFDDSRRNRSVSPERSSQKHERSRKRNRSQSPEPAPRKLQRKLSPKRNRPPERLATRIPVLFIPFEGNFNPGNIGGYQKHGNQTSSVFESRGFSPFIERRREKINDIDIPSTFGDPKFWLKRLGDVGKKTLLAPNKKGFNERIENTTPSPQSFYELVVADRLSYLKMSRYSSTDRGLPEVIILSERLLDWPEVLDVYGCVYRRRFVLGGRNLQDMAAFVLESAQFCYRFEVQERSASYSRHKFKETWLVVRKVTTSPPFSIACVHLSSKYTACTETIGTTKVMAEILQFARRHGIHAILGDCNLNTYGFYGGTFPVSSEFVVKDDEISLQTKFATTNGASDKAFMGGLICDPGVCFRSTLSTFGNCAVPPWFGSGPFKNEVFSDHHSIYGNYLLFEDGQRKDQRRRPRQAIGGDCFFEALARELETDETILDLRQRIIDGIYAAVVLEPNMAGARSVLVQVPGTDVAVPIQCESPQQFMTEMRRPGRWMEDTLIPYVAQSLNVRFLVQYDGYYARFEPDGSREDHGGVAPHELEGVRMNCQGNHFW